MKFIRSQTINSRKSGSVWALLEPNKKYIRELNETAGFIWSILKQPTTPEAIVRKVCQEYDVPRTEAAEDVARFLKEYKKLDLIKEIA